MDLYDKTIITESELAEYAAKLGQFLDRAAPYVLWLDGPMGAGKTTLVRQILRRLGLSQKTPVVSPTYTIVNEYKIDENWYAHIDFYRAGDDFSLWELGVLDTKDFHGIFVEWPMRPREDATIRPTYVLEIGYQDDQSRSYQLLK